MKGVLLAGGRGSRTEEATALAMRGRVAQATAIIIVSLGVSRLFQNWPRIWDVGLWDETTYLRAGLLNKSGAMLDYEVSGLYGKFYHLIALWVGYADPVRIYMLGGLAVILLGIAGVGAALWASSRNLSIAIAAVSWLSLSPAIDIWPRVAFLCIFIISIGFSASSLLKSPFAKLSIITLTCFLAAFVRPEYVISFYLAAGLAICCAIAGIATKMEIDRREIVLGLTAIGATICLSLAWSLPILHGGGRSFVAFGQHYALRAVDERHLDINPWPNWQHIIAADFPGAKSMADAFGMHPRLVLRFFGENLLYAPAILLWHLTPSLDDAWPLYCTLALVLFAIVWRRRTSGWQLKPSKIDVANAIILFLPPVLASVLVYPRDHYLLLGLTSGLFIIGSLIRATPRGSSVIAVAISVAFTLSVRPLPTVAQPTVASIDKLRSAGPIARMVEMDGGWCAYMTPVCEPYFPYDPASLNFGHFIQESGIDAVVVSAGLKGVISLQTDKSFQEFIETAERTGWSRRDIGGGSYMLLRQRPLAAITSTP